MKNRTITVFLLAYVLLGSVYSVTPTFADSHFAIQAILDESKQGIEDKFLDFGANGLEIPQDAISLYDEGSIKYDEAIALLIAGDFENAKDPGLAALSLFEDAYEDLLKAEEELAIEQEGLVEDLFEITESINELKIESDELRELISNNDLDISLVDLDATISLAEQELFAENVSEAESLIQSAEDIRDEILKRIEYKAEEEQDERVSKFVEDLIADLEDAIDLAIELGLDESDIFQLQQIIDELTDYDDNDKVFEKTGDGNDDEDVISISTSSLSDKVELEAELVDGQDEEGGEAEFEQRNDRKKLSVEVEDQMPDTTFDVLVNGVSVGQITTDEDGEGELDLDSRDGDAVDLVVDGDTVEISNGDGVVLLGTFSLDDDDEEKDDDDEAKEDDDDEEDEIDLKGTLTDNGDGTFDLTNENGITTISVNDETEIDDDLELSTLDGLEVEVDAIETDDGLLATEIEFDDKAKEDDDDEEDNSGSGNSNDDDEEDNSGSGNSNDDDEEDNSGSGNSNDDDEEDNSGSGNSNDDDEEDNSGSGNSNDDDEEDNSGSGNSNDDDEEDNSGSGNSNDDDEEDNSGSGNSNDDDEEDNSGSGNSNDDDEEDNSGSGNSNDDDDDDEDDDDEDDDDEDDDDE